MKKIKNILLIVSLILIANQSLAIMNKGGDVSVTPNNNMACSQETKTCSDGSLVSRNGPKCEFEKCKIAIKNDNEKEEGIKVQNQNERRFMEGEVSSENSTEKPKQVKNKNEVKADFTGAISNNNIKKQVRNENMVSENIDIKIGGINIKTDGELKKVKGFKFEGKDVEIKNGLEAKVEGNSIKFGNKTMKVEIKDAHTKAKNKVFADVVLETKIEKDNNGDVYYKIKTQKKSKFLWLLDFNLESEVKVDIESGDIIEVNNPWYSFLIF